MRNVIRDTDLFLLHHEVATVTGGVFSYLQTTRSGGSEGTRYCWSSAGCGSAIQYQGSKGGRSLSSARAIGLLMGWARASHSSLSDEVVQAAKRVVAGWASRYAKQANAEMVEAGAEAGERWAARNTLKIRGVEGHRLTVAVRGASTRGQRVVEFWDSRPEHLDGRFTALGQFISSYLLADLEQHPQGRGLDLYGGVSAWGVGADEMRVVLEWLRSLV